MLDQLRAIFDQIIKFQSTQDTLISRALFELELRKKKTDEIKENTEEVCVGICVGVKNVIR